MHALATRMLKELGEALKDFGTYTFDDKGPQEVMDCTGLVAELRKLQPTEAALVLTEVSTSKKYKGRGLNLCMELVCNMEDWDDLFAQPGMDDIYNGDRPGEGHERVLVPLATVSLADLFK